MTKAPAKKPEKPRDWKYAVEKLLEVRLVTEFGERSSPSEDPIPIGFEPGKHWYCVATCKDTAAAKKWIDDNADAKDGDEFRTIIETSHVVATVATITKRTYVANGKK